jgi:hypothetical protein
MFRSNKFVLWFPALAVPAFSAPATFVICFADDYLFLLLFYLSEYRGPLGLSLDVWSSDSVIFIIFFFREYRVPSWTSDSRNQYFSRMVTSWANSAFKTLANRKRSPFKKHD